MAALVELYWRALAGGVLIGLSGAIFLLGAGRIAGVSGSVARAVGLGGGPGGRASSLVFVLGLPLGALIIAAFAGGIDQRFAPATWMSVLGGVLVGVGTRLGSGCTSGHGVCGVSRLSRRSLVATVTFMVTGALTVLVLNRAGMAW